MLFLIRLSRVFSTYFTFPFCKCFQTVVLRCVNINVVRQGAVLIGPVVRIQVAVEYAITQIDAWSGTVLMHACGSPNRLLVRRRSTHQCRWSWCVSDLQDTLCPTVFCNGVSRRKARKNGLWNSKWLLMILKSNLTSLWPRKLLLERFCA